jgi:AbrB family looped-hinge helix DNA binding protein
VRLTSNRQVTIPMEIREKLGLLPHTEVEFEIDRDAVRIRKATAPRTMDRGRALIEHMRGRGTRRITTDQIMNLTRGGVRRSPLPDFYIGAHAALAGLTLLTRDAKRYRSYFPRLRIITP